MSNGLKTMNPTTLAAVVLVGLLILGGIYFLSHRSPDAEDMSQSQATTEGLVDTSAIDTQSNSDNTSSIERDLNSTNVATADRALY